MPTLIIATRNPGKAKEFAELLSGLPLQLESLDSHPEAPSKVEERGETYFDNARTKALAVARACGTPALADDSGLEVEALEGRPGLRSARFSGDGPAADIEKLLAELLHVPDDQRAALFRCVLVAAYPDGRTLTAEGTCNGRIARVPSGAGGFGYDPIFIDAESGQTFAELSEAHKNRISHRARAFAALRQTLVAWLKP